ncbi:jasmonate-induced protein [Striga asiatica]|uniref:Jasmonate-induced protein n=1 Tax=Striga asiatica TaxID=4170 RepID=A0A5A7NZI3_STRAF|nr:jasmonate-induced protein [Striga asiatica]
MASNVFGQAVTDEMVRVLFPNANPITNLNRAEAALRYINHEDRAINVNRFVHNLKGTWGTGTSTLGMVYNATGGIISLMQAHSWEGNVWGLPFPMIVQNGQWFGFLFVRDRLMGSAKGGLVYRGRDNSGNNRDWLISWETTRMNAQNRVFAQVRLSNSFNALNWGTINLSMGRQLNNFSIIENGGFAIVEIRTGSSPEFTGILSLDSLSPQAMTHASDLRVVLPLLDSKYNDLDATEEGGENNEATPAATATTAE